MSVGTRDTLEHPVFFGKVGTPDTPEYPVFRAVCPPGTRKVTKISLSTPSIFRWWIFWVLWSTEYFRQRILWVLRDNQYYLQLVLQVLPEKREYFGRWVLRELWVFYKICREGHEVYDGWG